MNNRLHLSRVGNGKDTEIHCTKQEVTGVPLHRLQLFTWGVVLFREKKTVLWALQRILGEAQCVLPVFGDTYWHMKYVSSLCMALASPSSEGVFPTVSRHSAECLCPRAQPQQGKDSTWQVLRLWVHTSETCSLYFCFNPTEGSFFIVGPKETGEHCSENSMCPSKL